MKYLLLPVFLFFFSCSNTEHPNRIRVSGEGKIRMMPNLVILTISVSFTKPRMVDAVSETQQTVDAVVRILEKFGRKDLDIKTSSISANKEYDYNGSTRNFIGYSAEQTIDFVLNDITKFTELTGKLLETRISSITRIQFNHSKADSLLREADLLAYDDALKSAKKLTNRANVNLGKLLFVSNILINNEDEYNDSYSIANGGRINTYGKGFGGRGFVISPEVIEFKRSISVEYQISD